jgi:hypothetical protein
MGLRQLSNLAEQFAQPRDLCMQLGFTLQALLDLVLEIFQQRLAIDQQRADPIEKTQRLGGLA